MMLLIVTGTSMLLAAIMSVIAWRIGGDQRRRSEARVAALSAEIHERDGGWALGDPPSPVQEDPACPTGDPGYTSLFVTPPTRSASRPFAIVGAGALVFGAVVAIAIVSGRGFTHAPGVASPAHATAAAALAADPIELVALGHERVGDQLTVRGVIRNPSSGAGMDGLTAVVLIFTPGGGFLASGRAVVEAPALRPGGESTFVVTVPRAGDVGRYRVSFRAGDRVVPHLDKRHES